MSKPTKMSEKNTTPERRSVRVTASAYKRPSAEESSKKPAPEIERMVSDERLKRKQGEIKVEDSKKLISAVEEKISEAEEVQYNRRVLDSKITRAKINTFINITETYNKLRQWLSPRQYEAVIHQPCIQHFLNLNTLGWAEQVFHNIVMQLTDHSGMDDALWFEVGEDLGRFSINEFCLITGMKCVGSTHLPPVVESRLITRYFSTLRGVSRENLELQMSNANFDNDNDAVKLSLLYMIFCIPLSNANSVKIDLKFFALADNLDNFNDFPWGVLSWEATRAAICNTVENKMSSKRRRPLKKSDKVHYSIAGFPHALLVWAYETLPSIAAKFTTKYDQAIPRMLSWITADNVKSDDVMSAFIAVGENQPKCFVIMPTEEELKDPWVAQLYLKNPKVLPQLSPKTSVPRPSSDTNSEWREFQKEIRGQVDSMNKKLEDLKKEQKKFIKLLRRVLKLLSDNMNENGKGKAHTAYHVSSRQKTNVQTDESIALKTTSNDIGTGSQDDVFIDSDIGTVADMGVQAAMEFLTADKVIVSHEDVEEEKNKMTVCQHCGDKGFEEALTLCKKCGLYALHRYCLEVLPEDLSEDMIWFCGDCGPNISKQSTRGKTNSLSSGLSVSVEVESPKKCRSGFKKNEKVVTASEAKTKVQTDEREPSGYEPRCREKCDEIQMLRRKRRFVLEDEEDQCLKTSLVAVSNDKASNVVEQRVTTGSEVKTEGQMCEDGSFSNGSQLREKCDKEQKLGRKMRLDLEDEEAKPSETSQVSVCHPKPANTFEQTVVNAEVQMCDVRSSSNKSQCGDECDKGQQLKIRQKTFQCSDPKPSNVLQHKVIAGSVEKRKLHFRDGGPSGNTPTSKEMCDYDQKPTEKQKLVLSDEEAEPVKIAQVVASHPKPSNILPQKDITGSVAKTKVLTRDTRPFGNEQQCREKYHKHQKLSEERKTSQLSDSKPLNISQQKAETGSVAKMPVQIRDRCPFGSEPQHRGKGNKYQKLSTQRYTSRVSDPKPSNISQQKAISCSVAKTKVKIRDRWPYRSGPPLYRGRYSKDQKFRKRQRRLPEDDEAVDPLKTYQAEVSDPKLFNGLEQSSYLEAQPIINPMWNGCLSICNKNLNTRDRLIVAAHLSNLACPKVYEVAKLLPEVIFLELSNRSDFWPRSFQKSGPSYHHIAVYFFPENKSDENVFDSLVNNMINQDLAMRAVLEVAELLVFTSYALPVPYRRFQMKHYLWGVIWAKQV